MPENRSASPADDTAFFGHPRGLGWIFAAEAGWAFAYYGLVTIMTLYMSQQLFLPGHVENIWGFGAYRGLLESMIGKMSPLELASETFGLITAAVYVTPIVGGLLADRWLGHRRAITLGFAAAVGGFCLLVTEQGFLVGALLLVLAGGMIKSNFLGQLGRLYGLEDTRRTRAFGIFLIAVNVGGFLAPMVVGTLGEKVGWTPALAACAVGSLVGLASYVMGVRHMPADVIARPVKGAAKAPPLARADLIIVAALCLVMLTEVMNAGTYNQAFNIFPVWAKAHVDRNLFGFEMPVTWFSTLDGVLTILATALAVRFWGWQARTGREPRDTTRIAVGTLMLTSAFGVLVLAAMLSAGGAKAPIVLPILFFVLADGALPWVDTVLMSLVSRAAPPALNTTMLGVFYLTYAAGNFMVGTLGRLYEHMTPVVFWSVHAAIAGAAAVYIFAVGGWLNSLISRRGVPLSEPEPAAA